MQNATWLCWYVRKIYEDKNSHTSKKSSTVSPTYDFQHARYIYIFMSTCDTFMSTCILSMLT